MVLFAPLVPLLPLVAAHPAKHKRNTLFIREFDNVLTGDLRFPTQHIDPEILDIPQDLGFSLGIVAIQQVRGVITSTDPEVATVDLEIKIPAPTLIRELLVLVAVLGNTPYPEAKVRAVRNLPILHKLQMQIVKGRSTHSVWPPEVGIVYDQGGVFFRGKRDFANLSGGEVEALFEFNGRLSLSRNCSLQFAGDGLRGEIMQVCINRKARSRLRQGKLRVDHRVFERDLTRGF